MLCIVVWGWEWKEERCILSPTSYELRAHWEKKWSPMQSLFQFLPPCYSRKFKAYKYSEYACLAECVSPFLQVVQRYHSSLLRHRPPGCLWRCPQWTWRTVLSLWALALSWGTRSPQDQIPSEREVGASWTFVPLVLKSFFSSIKPYLKLFGVLSTFWKPISNFLL